MSEVLYFVGDKWWYTRFIFTLKDLVTIHSETVDILGAEERT